MDDQIRQVKVDVNLEKWKRLIMDYNQSGMTVTDWCKVNNVAVSTFYKHQKKVRIALLNSTSLPVKQPAHKFVPLVTESNNNELITITKGDIKIELSSNSNIDTIVNMIKVLIC